MKVLLYTENEKFLSKSGLGKAIRHQMKALDWVNIEYTTDVSDNYDIAHINFYGLKSYLLAKKLKKQGKKIVYHAHSTEEDFRNSFIFSNQVSKIFKKWLIKCYTLGDAIITPTEYSKKLLEGYGINKDIRSVNNISNKIENAIISNEEKQLQILKRKKELENEIEELKDLVEEAEIRLDSLYKKEREILTAYYVDNREAEEIGRNLYFDLYNRTCSAENIYKIIKKATKKILEL